jgi:hypothetical protein
MEHLRLPADGDDRARLGGHRDGDASVDPALLRLDAGFTGFDVCRSSTTPSGCICFGPNADPDGRPM